MNPFTQLVWDVIADCPAFLEQLVALMRRDCRPFLTGERAFQANTKELEHSVRAEVDR